MAARRNEVERVAARISRWAQGRADLVAVAVVGSWARGAARVDSDLDLLVLVEDPAGYVEHDNWVTEIGAVGLVATRPWGAVTERRALLPSGLEVEVGFAPRSWAVSRPVDAGTARVVGDGMWVLHDPEGLLEAVSRAVRDGLGPERSA